MKLNAKWKSFLNYVWQPALWLLVGLCLVGYFGWNIKYPPINADETAVTVYMPPRAEVRTEEGVRAVTQVRGGEVGPFRIFVSQDEFDRLVAQSSYQPLVSHTTDGSTAHSFTQSYWLSRGDGAWYTTTYEVPAKYWNFWWDTKWVRQTDTQWVAQPVFDSEGSWWLLVIGVVIGLSSLIELLSALGRWQDDAWTWAYNN